MARKPDAPLTDDQAAYAERCIERKRGLAERLDRRASIVLLVIAFLLGTGLAELRVAEIEPGDWRGVALATGNGALAIAALLNLGVVAIRRRVATRRHREARGQQSFTLLDPYAGLGATDQELGDALRRTGPAHEKDLHNEQRTLAWIVHRKRLGLDAAAAMTVLGIAALIVAALL
jgi:hypothetical protein